MIYLCFLGGGRYLKSILICFVRGYESSTQWATRHKAKITTAYGSLFFMASSIAIIRYGDMVAYPARKIPDMRI